MIKLRTIRPEDKEMIRNWRNLPEVSKYMFTDHHITREEHDAWFQSMINDPHSQYWIVVFNNEDVGLANIYNIDKRNQHCHWGRYIASQEFRGKGLGTYIEYWVLRYVFETLGLNKLCTEVLSFNDVVLNMHRRFGFRKEGVLREHVFKEGKHFDVVLMAILCREWEERKSAIEDHLRSKNIDI